MGLFQTLEAEAGKRGLKFLVIGGLAVNMHGYSRDTADLDLLVQEESRADWLTFLQWLGYEVLADKGAFAQLSPPKKGAWPVDLMFVREPTFAAIFEHGRKVDIYDSHVLIPSLEHLLMLKLHALKHSHTGRFLKDFLDVANLVRVNKLDVSTESVRQMFLKYGNVDLYEKISRACADGES